MFKSFTFLVLLVVTSAVSATPMVCRKHPSTPSCAAVFQQERQANAIKHTPTRTVSQRARYAPQPSHHVFYRHR